LISISDNFSTISIAQVVLQAMPTNAALQEEVRSLEKELEESMYIPPRRAGAPVIEEVRLSE
jgi:hypothetical protein